MLKLIIVDLDENLLSVWSEVLQGISDILFMNINFRTIAENPEINAVLLRNIFAYERYGFGKPKKDESEIFSTYEQIGMPSWVVTTPFFTQDITYMPQEYDYFEFSKVFESIEKFNHTDKEPKIKTLGFEISFLYGFRNTSPDKTEPEGLRRAYLEYCNLI